MHNTNPPPPHARGSRRFLFPFRVEKVRIRVPHRTPAEVFLLFFLRVIPFPFALHLATRGRGDMSPSRAGTQVNAMRSAFLFHLFLSSLLPVPRHFRPSVPTSREPLIFETRLRRRGSMERKEDARVYRRRKFITRRRLISSTCPPPSCIFIKSSLRVAGRYYRDSFGVALYYLLTTRVSRADSPITGHLVLYIFL